MVIRETANRVCHYYHSHFISEDIKAQKGLITYQDHTTLS